MNPIMLADVSLLYTHSTPVRQKILSGSNWAHEEPEEAVRGQAAEEGIWDFLDGTVTDLSPPH